MLEKTIIPVLYHGTDARIIAMPKEIRLQYMSNVNKAIDYMWSIYKPSYYGRFKYEIPTPDGSVGFGMKREFEKYKSLLKEKGAIYLYENLYEKLSMLDCRDNGAGLYQYGNLYLSSKIDSAKRYAYRSFAGGELGLIAYNMIKGIEIINFPDWNPTEEICSIINKIKDFSKEDYRDPVVISIENVDVDDLLTEDGKRVGPSILSRLNRKQYDFKFRYLKNIQLDLEHAEHLPTHI